MLDPCWQPLTVIFGTFIGEFLTKKIRVQTKYRCFQTVLTTELLRAAVVRSCWIITRQVEETETANVLDTGLLRAAVVWSCWIILYT